MTDQILFNMRFPYLYLLLLFPLFGLMSQSDDLLVSTAAQTGKVSFEFDYAGFYAKTILLDIPPGQYTSSSYSIPLFKTVHNGRGRLLSVITDNQSPSYSITSVNGCLNTKASDVKYLLPITAGKTTEVIHLQNLAAELLGKEKPENWYALALSMQANDTVFAARRGIVVEVVDGKTLREGSNLSFSASYNYVVIEHEDCTWMRYELLKSQKIFVALGDEIEASEPIGEIANGERLSIGTHLRLTNSYVHLTQEIISNYRSASSTPLQNIYVPMTFHTTTDVGLLADQTSYISEHPATLIMQEMSKRQQKRWAKRQ